MKQLLFALTLVMIAGCTQAQDAAVKNPSPGISNIPVFHILSKDSVYLTNAKLKKGKPVMFIYFAPDCSHCERLIMELKPDVKQFKDIQIVMVTFIKIDRLKMLKEFQRDYVFSAQPNVLMGTEDPDYKVMRYFAVGSTPYIAIYGRNGKLVQAFDKAPKVPELIAAVKKAE